MYGQDDAEEFAISAALGWRPLCNLWFADDIDFLSGSVEGLQQPRWNASGNNWYGMEISLDRKANSSSTASRLGQQAIYGWVEKF